MLNVFKIINNKTSSSATYIIDSYGIWHSKLKHVNFSYIKKMVELNLIPKLSLENHGKCEAFIESKTIKKSCKFVQRESKQLSLLHNDLRDPKNIITSITFIDDYSRYKRVYLFRNKDEARVHQVQKESRKSTK